MTNLKLRTPMRNLHELFGVASQELRSKHSGGRIRMGSYAGLPGTRPRQTGVLRHLRETFAQLRRCDTAPTVRPLPPQIPHGKRRPQLGACRIGGDVGFGTQHSAARARGTRVTTGSFERSCSWRTSSRCVRSSSRLFASKSSTSR